jgi:hypothetical protein
MKYGVHKTGAHPCILNMVYSRKVERSISQDGEGESERTLEAKSLKRRLDPLTIFHKDRTVSTTLIQGHPITQPLRSSGLQHPRVMRVHP